MTTAKISTSNLCRYSIAYTERLYMMIAELLIPSMVWLLVVTGFRRVGSIRFSNVSRKLPAQPAVYPF